jgi:3-methyladenine DNA glycosylase AlkD
MKTSSDNSLISILHRLQSLADPNATANVARFGIVTTNSYGIPAPKLKQIAKEIGRDHRLAAQLWKTGNLDARALAALINDPAKVTEAQMERWVSDFDNWAVCDGCCLYLFSRTPFAWTKAIEWTHREEEFVRRAGFTLMAVLAVHDTDADDRKFLRFLPLIKRYAIDERNFVKKAVNWALRQLGKRSLELNRRAIAFAEEIRRLDSRSARWIANDALRELRSQAVQNRLKKKTAHSHRKDSPPLAKGSDRSERHGALRQNRRRGQLLADEWQIDSNHNFQNQNIHQP